MDRREQGELKEIPKAKHTRDSSLGFIQNIQTQHEKCAQQALRHTALWPL